MLYDSPKELLPTDQSTELIKVFARSELYPYTAITNCIITQEATNRNTIILDAGTDEDHYVIATLFYTKANDISKGFDSFIPMHFEDGAVHTIVGAVYMGGYKFESDKSDPLVFKVDYRLGYVYLNGTGTVTGPHGDKIIKGRPTKQVILGKALGQ